LEQTTAPVKEDGAVARERSFGGQFWDQVAVLTLYKEVN
jgi:hypothetical protein